MTHFLFRENAMFTRTKNEWTANTLRRLAAGARFMPRLFLTAGLFALTIGSGARAQDNTAGAVRISDLNISQGSPVYTQSSPVYQGGPVVMDSCPEGCPPASQGRGLCGHCCLGKCCLIGPESGYGCRFLDMHWYNVVYAVDPWYIDRRDAQVYAAQGYGAPMSVPLAPNVTNQFNYGWGIPSSRITAISRVTPQMGTIPGAIAPR